MIVYLCLWGAAVGKEYSRVITLDWRECGCGFYNLLWGKKERGRRWEGKGGTGQDRHCIYLVGLGYKSNKRRGRERRRRRRQAG